MDNDILRDLETIRTRVALTPGRWAQVRIEQYIASLTAQRDRALEAVEKLRDKGNELRLHIDYDRWPNECDAWDEALAATEPAAVDQNKEPS